MLILDYGNIVQISRVPMDRFYPLLPRYFPLVASESKFTQNLEKLLIASQFKSLIVSSLFGFKEKFSVPVISVYLFESSESPKVKSLIQKIYANTFANFFTRLSSELPIRVFFFYLQEFDISVLRTLSSGCKGLSRKLHV